MNFKRTEYQQRMDNLFARWIEGKFLTDEEQQEMVAHATGKRDSNGNPTDNEPAKLEPTFIPESNRTRPSIEYPPLPPVEFIPEVNRNRK